MAYRLIQTESSSTGVRRIADEQLARAIGELQDPALDAAVRLHQVRKRVKKVRALLRLVRPAIGKAAFRIRNERLRRLNRQLAGPRDAQVMVETATALAGDHPDLASLGYDTAREYLQLRLETERDLGDAAGSVDMAVDTLASLRDDIANWPLYGDDFALVSGGLKQAYSRGRRALGEALSAPGDESLHALRKRIKDHVYHARLLRETWPAMMRCRVSEAGTAAGLLGDRHDLAVLVRELAAMPDGLLSDTEQKAWRQRIGREQAALQQRALWISRRLYAEPAKRFIARSRAYWLARQHAGGRADAAGEPVGRG
jgi:CHAD domain-containing protein